MNADGVLVVGYGNALRGDDAVGHRVAELPRRRRAAARVRGSTPATSSRPSSPKRSPPHGSSCSSTPRQSDGRPGDVRIERVVGSGRPIGSHTVDVSALVDLAELVYGNAPPVVLVTVTAERFDLGADLSSPVASALARVVDAVVAVVDTLPTEPGRRDQGPIGVGR